MDSEQSDDLALHITPQCVVTLRADGLQIQQIVEAPPQYLDLPRLELLRCLDAEPVVDVRPVVREVAERTGARVRQLQAFADDLRYGNWLGPVEPPAHRSVVDHASLDEIQPFDLDEKTLVSVAVPMVVRLRGGAFELIDHEGAHRFSFTSADLRALAMLIRPKPARKVLEKMARQKGAEHFDEARLALVLGALDGAGLLRRSRRQRGEATEVVDRDLIIRNRFKQHAKQQDAAEAERRARTGVTRTQVVPVSFDISIPLALGMLIAYAKVHDGEVLQDTYEFRTDWIWNEGRFKTITERPAVYLFSDYLWSHERCLAVSEAVKERSPASITIHGGPDCPKYEADCEAYFRDHPHVDITVRGEGEITCAEVLAALAPVMGQERPDLSVLAGVNGISYRAADGSVVRNPDRERLSDLSVLPSPFLTGIFDAYSELPDIFATLESNRGCPYGCTFCDWGSATTSRIRQFDLDRVFAEFDWISKHKINSTSLADANFGIFKRDVEIAQHVADARSGTGWPQLFGVSYAKNTVKHLQEIIRILAGAGIVTTGVLSLQSMDEVTLQTINRSNIKTERYDALAGEMRRARLPLMVELMMGLPGMTLESFADDLQQCIDREVRARINQTAVLVNSPMNEPTYRAENEIEVTISPGRGQQSIIVSTSSFTRADRDAMQHLRLDFMLFENWGVLRLVARFVRHQTGMREMDFYRAFARDVEAEPGRWPSLHALVTLGTSMMTAPYSWWLVAEEMRDYLVQVVGLADDSALDSVLRAQHAVLPAHGRTLPDEVSLTHDVVGWQQAISAAKAQGHLTDWPDYVTPLIEHGPGSFTVTDPDGVLDHGLGMNRELTAAGVGWELESPLSRTGIAASNFSDWVSDRMMPFRK